MQLTPSSIYKYGSPFLVFIMIISNKNICVKILRQKFILFSDKKTAIFRLPFCF